MSELNPMRATSGSAQNPASAKPSPHTTGARRAPRAHSKTGSDATTTTITVSTWQSAVSARASAAHGAHRRSSRTVRISRPK